MANVVIMGAAGRDFHDFNVYYRNRVSDHVVTFTAAQIPIPNSQTLGKRMSEEDQLFKRRSRWFRARPRQCRG